MRTGRGDLLVEIFDRDQDKNEFEGEVRIPLSKLADQYKHDEWFELYDKRGSRLPGKIHLVMQWVHSRVKYYEEVISKWNEHIHTHEEDLAEYEHDLDVLYQPFPLLKSGAALPKERPLDASSAPVLENFLSNTTDFISKASFEIKPLQLSKNSHVTYFAALGWFFLSIMASFCRPTFLDVIKQVFGIDSFVLCEKQQILALTYCASHVVPSFKLNKFRLMFTMAGLSLSIFFDVLWIPSNFNVLPFPFPLFSFCFYL